MLEIVLQTQFQEKFPKSFFPWEISNWWDNILQRSKVAFLKDTLSLPQRDLLKINHWMIKGWCRKKALLGKTAMHWRKVFSPKNPNLSAGSAVLWIWSRENFRSCQQKIALVHANAFLEYSKTSFNSSQSGIVTNFSLHFQKPELIRGFHLSNMSDLLESYLDKKSRTKTALYL